jgi:SAM-dependent methyltransferase
MQSDIEHSINYWTSLYKERERDCVFRVYNITKDFINNVDDITLKTIQDAYFVFEFGCGTGEALGLFSLLNLNANFVGVDISKSAIQIAKRRHKDNKRLVFYERNVIGQKPDTKYDLVFCSNTLEHFKDPFYVVEDLFKHGDKLLILVPYNEQDLRDGYDQEGGAGHVYSFTENSFKDYNVLSWFTFFTHEWLIGPEPLQMSVLIEKK